MKALRPRAAIVATALGSLWLGMPASTHAQSTPPASSPALVGEWSLDRDLSDTPQDRTDEGERGGARRGQGGRGGFGGRGRFGGGGAGRSGATINAEDREPRREAMRDVMTAPERLTIAQTESMVIVTTGDGRVTRLSPDGKKIKDESTGIGRKSKWDGGRLVSEISGLGGGKVTETYAADPEHHQLRVSLQIDGGERPRTITRVYDASGDRQ